LAPRDLVAESELDDDVVDVLELDDPLTGCSPTVWLPR
jgi:hypothetical protein